MRISRAALAFGLAILTVCCTRTKEQIVLKFPSGDRKTLPLKGTLRISQSSYNFDWHVHDNRTLDNIMEGLIQYDLSGAKVALKPALAASWEPFENGRKWRFTLRDDVRWSDGIKFQAAHVIDGWRRLLDPKTASVSAYFLFAIKNAQAYQSGKVSFDKVGVRVVAPNLMEVELEKPTVFFPYLLTNAATFPVRSDLIAKYGEKWIAPENLVTLGPYRLTAIAPDRFFVLEQNTSYYDRGAFTSQTPERVVVYSGIEDAELNMFEGGELDLVPYVAPTRVRSLTQQNTVQHTEKFSVSYLGFGTSKAPLNDVEFRKAIASAIDREALAKSGAGLHPLNGWIPKGMFAYEADTGLPFSVSKAKEWLKQSHPFTDAKAKRLELAIYQHDDQAIAENIQFQLKQNLGLDVMITYQEWKAMVARFKNDPPQMFLHGWDVDYPDPDNLFSLVTSGSGNNRTQWKDAAYDSLIEQAAGELNQNKRRALYREAQDRMLVKAAAVVPLYSGDGVYLTSARIARYPANPFGKIILKEVQLR